MKKQTHKLLAVMLAVIMIFSAAPTVTYNTFAETEGIFQYTVNYGEATITGLTNTSYSGELIIPSTLGGYPVTAIGSLRYCAGITSIYIPASITYINDYDDDWMPGVSAFVGCTSLENITVDSNNTAYHSVDNCLIETRSNTLIAVCKNAVVPANGNYIMEGDPFLEVRFWNKTTVIIPEGISYVLDPFQKIPLNCDTLILPESLETIGVFFPTSRHIEKVYLGNSIKYVDGNSFCCTVSEVHYNGTPDEWKKITFEDFNNSLYKAKIFYICDDSGHNYTATNVIEPTCSYGGYTTYTCSRCGESYTSDYTAPSEHKCDNWTVTKNSTCQVEGTKIGVCKLCGEDLEETIPIFPHAYDAWRYETLPSCGDDGKIICTCLLCTDKKTITVDALGHEYSNAWTVDSEPTCTAAGYKSHHCIRCDATSDVTEIEATGHNYSDVVVSPTCTKGGYTSHVCTVCGSAYKTDILDAAGHAFTHFAAKDPTCTEAGWAEYDTCDVCGYTTYEEIDALGHDYQETENGYACSRCDAVIENGETEEHRFVKTIVKPTEQSDGYTQYICLDCGYYYRTDETHFESGSKFSVSNMVAGSGKKVVLTVSISDNPGIYSFTLGVDYDKNNMTLTGINNLNKLGGNLSLGNDKVLWLNNNGADSTFNGDAFQLVFDISAHATAQDYLISLSYEAGNIVNHQLTDVNFALESGVVSVEGFTAGDINGDGLCNNKDLVIMSEIFARNYTAYKKGKAHTENNRIKAFNLFGTVGINLLKDVDIVVLGVNVERAALDINNDGIINNYDLLTMMKYLRGEEIEIL